MDSNMQMNQQAPIMNGPARKLKTNRGMIKYILLNLVTLSIYNLVFFSGISEDLNLVAGRYDGKKTMHFLLLFFIVGPITLGIADLVWFHKMSKRVGNEARRRGIATTFGAGSFWLWNVLGACIVVGPFVYLHKLAKTMNQICENYNTMGI